MVGNLLADTSKHCKSHLRSLICIACSAKHVQANSPYQQTLNYSITFISTPKPIQLWELDCSVVGTFAIINGEFHKYHGVLFHACQCFKLV